MLVLTGEEIRCTVLVMLNIPFNSYMLSGRASEQRRG